jgi:tRNA dimethylallyltransferase
VPAPAIICLMGATATGKTELALDIARRFPVEIVSVDSALVYRGMDIGTAKPEPEILRAVPHHLVDIVDPAETFSAWDFNQQARQLARQITARGRVALLAGGTMLYYHAFEHGLNRLPEADAELRRRIEAEARQLGWAGMHGKLARIDPASAARIRPTDPQRIQRALEVYEISGQPLSRLQQGDARAYPGRIDKIILAVEDRAALHRRIELRFMQMLEQGLLDEVRALRARGDLNPSLPSMRCVGYRQVWQYLDGELTHAQMVDRSIAATRQLAKRQLTWLRKQPQNQAFDCLHYSKDAIFRLVDAAISRPRLERY